MRYTPRRGDLTQETDELARVLAGPTFPFLYLETLNAVPVKPQEGMIIKLTAAGAAAAVPALGTGAGVYCYRGGAWTFLG